MILVELYSKDDCHLCEIAKKIVLTVQRGHPFEFKEKKILESDERYEEFKERIPVIYIDKKFAFQHRVTEQEFIEKLRSTS